MPYIERSPGVTDNNLSGYQFNKSSMLRRVRNLPGFTDPVQLLMNGEMQLNSPMFRDSRLAYTGVIEVIGELVLATSITSNS